MASSRLEKIGNIYTRITGLLKSGAMQWENRPIFYDIYTAFPPLKERKYKENPPNMSLRQIFYEEDKERATKDYTNVLFNMNDKKPAKPDFSGYTQKYAANETVKEESKEKIFDLKNLELNKE